MNSTFRHAALVLAGLGVAVAAVPATAQSWQSINQRQRTIDNRIDQGVRSGALNRAEATRLRTQVRDLARLEVRYQRSGNGLSRAERRDLDARYDRLATRVRFQKNDRQHRR